MSETEELGMPGCVIKNSLPPAVEVASGNLHLIPSGPLRHYHFASYPPPPDVVQGVYPRFVLLPLS